MSEGELPPVRRVVTGHDGNNIAKALIDGPATNAKAPSGGLTSRLIWYTSKAPCDVSVGEAIDDMGAHNIGTPPPPNGTRCSVLDLMPGNKAVLHRTETLDYVFVLAGEVEMDLDDSTVKLKAGDIVVQRGTNHAWANRSNAPARIGVVLVDAAPLGIGHPVPRGQLPQ